MVKKGAMAKGPFQVSNDPAQLEKQITRTQRRIDAKGGLANAPVMAARMQQLQAAKTGNQNQYAFGNQMQNLWGQMQNQQPMPTDYGEMRQKAEATAMDSFNRNMQPQFQNEEAAFRQRMAEQGIDPNSEGAQRQYSQMKQSQNAQTQNAMTGAFQAGQGEQAQMYGQAYQNQMMPYQQMGALMPIYQTNAANQMQNAQNAWQGKQNDLNRDVQRYGIRNNGGGGGTSLQDRFALMDREFYNNLAMYAMQNGQAMPGQNPYVAGAVSGIGAGTAAGVGSGLR